MQRSRAVEGSGFRQPHLFFANNSQHNYYIDVKLSVSVQNRIANPPVQEIGKSVDNLSSNSGEKSNIPAGAARRPAPAGAA